MDRTEVRRGLRGLWVLLRVLKEKGGDFEICPADSAFLVSGTPCINQALQRKPRHLCRVRRGTVAPWDFRQHPALPLRRRLPAAREARGGRQGGRGLGPDSGAGAGSRQAACSSHLANSPLRARTQ